MKRPLESIFHDKQALVRSHIGPCEDTAQLTGSGVFKEALSRYLDFLKGKRSTLLDIFPPDTAQKEQFTAALELLRRLAIEESPKVIKDAPHLEGFFSDTYRLWLFVENFYNYWRSYERFFIYYSTGEEEAEGRTPYVTFFETIERLNHLVRKVHRDISRHITGESIRVYRQVPAGCQVGVIVSKEDWPCPEGYENIRDIPFIRQILLNPPLIIDPPMNKRAGHFRKVDENPIEGLEIDPAHWLCYPARVGELMIHLYFNHKFMNLGTSLINLFYLAGDEEIAKKPDALYFFGVPSKKMERFGENRTVFYEDEERGLLVGAVPDDDAFGYFGYAKKMMLTLHNIIMMKRGRFPVHGAMARVTLKDGKSANVVILGDSGTGKSETLEAFRSLSERYLKEITIVFDDMGSLELEDDRIVAYGTETGAFIRLDDLSLDFAFGNIDRSIIMSPQKINARAVLPITTLKEILHGYKVDYMLYANNYEDVDEERPYLERLLSVEEALHVFREGARMAKGTTMEKGLVHSYFANVFGPSQYKEMHEPIAKRFFEKMFALGIPVAQLRTRLGIPGLEKEGPRMAAKALFEAIRGE